MKYFQTVPDTSKLVVYCVKWTYTVVYNANGGTGTTASSSHVYNASKSLTANGFTRTNYTFLGWSTSASAKEPTYTNGASVKNLSPTNGTTVTLYLLTKVDSKAILKM